MLQTPVRGGSALINVMAGAAFKASKGLIRDFNEVEHLQVSRKGPGDFVSAADHRAEKIIHQELLKARPDFSFLMEESGEIKGVDERHRWIVDPLDGTTNFLHAIPHFCISIGLEFEGEILAGVVYDPIKDELFHAEKGKGAFVNDYRLRVSSRHILADAVLGISGPQKKFESNLSPQFYENFLELPHLVAALRHFGAGALDLCYVAAGRFDGFLGSRLAPWDMAAGIVIIREAGGYVDELTGKGTLFETGCLMASNHKLRDVIRKGLSEKK